MDFPKKNPTNTGPIGQFNCYSQYINKYAYNKSKNRQLLKVKYKLHVANNTIM